MEKKNKCRIILLFYVTERINSSGREHVVAGPSGDLQARIQAQRVRGLGAFERSHGPLVDARQERVDAGQAALDGRADGQGFLVVVVVVVEVIVATATAGTAKYPTGRRTVFRRLLGRGHDDAAGTRAADQEQRDHQRQIRPDHCRDDTVGPANKNKTKRRRFDHRTPTVEDCREHSWRRISSDL